MSLNGVESTNGYLECVTKNGTAVSLVKNPGSFDEIRNISSKHHFKNIQNLPEDYLSYNDPIPNMTSSNTPSGEVFSNFSVNQGYTAFDGNSGTYIVATVIGEYVTYKFDAPEPINRYSISRRTSTTYPPTSWIIYGSNNNIDWDTLDIASASWLTQEVSETKIFALDATVTYQYYKLEVTGYIYNGSITELSFFLGTPSAQDVVVSSDEIQVGDNILVVKDDDSVASVSAQNITMVNPTEVPIIPSMADYIQDGFTVTFSSEYPGDNYRAFNMYDGYKRWNFPFWQSNHLISDDSGWTKIEFDQNYVVTAYRISPNSNNTANNIYSFTLEGFDEFGVSLGIIETRDLGYIGSSVFHYYKLAVPTEVRAIKIQDTDTRDGSAVVNLQYYHEVMDSYEVDVSSVTNGESPSKAYLEKENIKLNNASIIKSFDTYDTTNDWLEATRSYSNSNLVGSTLETTVEMSTVGNKLIELSFELWRQL